MKINDSVNPYQSLYHDSLYWADCSSTQYPFDPDFVRNANFSLDKVSAVVMRFDNTWQWRDANLTTQPIADGDLVSGQSVYPLTLAHLKLERVRVKDRNGNYVTLKPKSRRSLTDDDLAATGTPTTYDKLGSGFVVNPTPDYDSEGGVEIQTQTTASYFTSSDTTKEPGFAPQFHRLISLMAALDYAKVNSLVTRVKLIGDEIGYVPEDGRAGAGMLNELALFYSQRDYDQEPRLELQKSNRGVGLL